MRTAHRLAAASPRVTADAITTVDFPQLTQRYEVMAVPKIVINDTLAFDGALPEDVFVQHVVAAAAGDDA